MKKALEIAKSIDKSLRSDDSRFNRSVLVLHEDGAVLFFRYAFLVTYFEPTEARDWLLIFTEHHNYHVYDIDDLDLYGQFESIELDHRLFQYFDQFEQIPIEEHQVAESTFAWTSEKPKVAGWFGYRKFKSQTPRIVEVLEHVSDDETKLFMEGWNVKHHDGEWFGPIPFPPEKS